MVKIINTLMLLISLSPILFAQPGTYYSLDSALKTPTDVKILNLRYAGIEVLPAEIKEMINLEVIYLAGNELATLPPEIGLLTNLKELHLEDNFINRLPGEIGQLKNLTVLNIPYNELDTLPQELFEMVSLKKMNLRSNKLSKRQQELLKFSLQDCRISFTENDLIEPSHPLLTDEELLQANVFMDLEKAMQVPHDVFIMRLSKKKLTSIPETVFGLKNIQSLDLSENKLSAIPPIIQDLEMLQNLNLRSNILSTLPPELKELPFLKVLKLGINSFKDIPEVVFQCSKLNDLDFSFNNKLTAIPDGIGQLVNLKKLNFYACQINKISGEIGKLKNLEEIDLHGNNITILPKEMAECDNLLIINLNSNLNLDYEQALGVLKNCKRLYSIDLRNTSIPTIKRNKIKADFPNTELIF